MESGPFILITFGLLFALGLMISTIERTVVMKHWDKRRCDFPVMMASMFFKPESDSRSKTDFAKDNFSFCMKTYIDKFMELLMAPIMYIFGKQANVAASSIDMLNTIRTITKTMYDAFLSYLDEYYKKFNASVFEMSRIVQHLRMAMRRLNAMMVSMIYTGITMFRGMLNTIQFIIKVILTICGIMLGIMIILIFVLFPFIPMILAVLGTIVSTVLILSEVIPGSVASEASSMKGGFCFSKDTKIVCEGVIKDVSEIKIGDELEGCGKVTAVIEMVGKDIKLYNLKGIYVSGTHLVEGEDGWKSVSNDSRANITMIESDILYCFNTTSHNIPVFSPELSKAIIFRDWEEIADDDEKGQYIWNYLILKKLNNLSNYSKWKNGLHISANIPIMGNTKVKTNNGFIDISELQICDKVMDRNNNEQTILGIVKGVIEGNGDERWNTGLYEFVDGSWIKGKSTVLFGTKSIEGRTLITETGEFIIWDDKEKLVRDFTDIGYQSIHETYPFVASRLRTKYLKRNK